MKTLSFLCVLFVACIHPSIAGINNPGSGSSTSSVWNGGLVQTSMSSAPDTSGEFVPINRFLDAQDWLTVTGGNPVPVNDENAEGFPSNNTDLAAEGGWKTFFSIPSASEKPGNYDIVWTGAGSTTINPGATSIISISGSGCTISGNTVLGVNCTAVVSYSGTTGPQLQITSVSSGGPTSLQVYNVNDAALIAAGYVCKGTKFASTVGANFGVIRDLNRSNANFSNVSFWAERTPVNWFSYAAQNYFPASLVTTNQPTLSSGAEYTLAFSAFALTDKAKVIANFAAPIVAPSYTSNQTVSSGTTLQLTSSTGIVAGMHAGDANSQNALQQTVTVLSVNSGTNTVTFNANPFQGTVTSGDTIYFSPMLNVNSTGYVPMLGIQGATLGTQNTDNTFHANWSTFIYDAGLNAFLIWNGGSANKGLSGGTPPEVFTKCANEIGAHPWYVMPPYSVDAPTDYATQLAAYVQANLLPGLIPRYEGPNETWNNGFFVTGYAYNKEYLRTSKNFDSDNWYGRIISELGQTISSAYGANRALYQVNACMNSISTPVAASISTGSYNSGTGLVTLTTSTSLAGLGSGEGLSIRGLTGTGSISSANGPNFTTTSGSTGTTINYTIATGLTMTISPGATSYAELTGGQNNKLLSPEYVSNGGSAAYNWVTNICPTAYYESSFATTSTEIGYAYWYVNGASSGQKDTIVNNYLAGTLTQGIANDLYWLNNSVFIPFAAYTATYSGIGYTQYEGGYASTGGCGFSYNCGLVSNAGVSSVAQGSTTILTVGGTSTSATQSGNTLTIGGSVTGAFAVNQQIVGSGFATGTTITGLMSGTGGTGTYRVNISQTVASPVSITSGPFAWNYICNTASLCNGTTPTTTLAFGGGCGLNGLDPAVLSATATTITVNVNSTGFTGCTTGTAAYDGAGSSSGYVFTFENGVKQNTNSSNLAATELTFLQDFYAVGGRFPAEYDDSDSTDWGKYYPNVYAATPPVITAVQAFQASP